MIHDTLALELSCLDPCDTQYGTIHRQLKSATGRVASTPTPATECFSDTPTSRCGSRRAAPAASDRLALGDRVRSGVSRLRTLLCPPASCRAAQRRDGQRQRAFSFTNPWAMEQGWRSLQRARKCRLAPLQQRMAGAHRGQRVGDPRLAPLGAPARLP